MASDEASEEPWGTSQYDGKAVRLFSLTAESGAVLKVSNYGAHLVSLLLPDKAGGLEDVLLGFDDLASYEKHVAYIGSAVGRVCSRIGGAAFQLGDETYKLTANNGSNCLHGE